MQIVKALFGPFVSLTGSHPRSSEPQQSRVPRSGCCAAVAPQSVGGAVLDRAAGRRRGKGR